MRRNHPQRRKEPAISVRRSKPIWIRLTGMLIMAFFCFLAGTAGVHAEASTDQNGDTVLIAYFTVPEDVSLEETDAVSGASILRKDDQVYGNTEYIANLIAARTGGALFAIESAADYPREHAPLLDAAAEEQNTDARPELTAVIDHPEAYDTIFIGYPIWWGDLPQPLYTFLETYDFSGKTIILFCVHGGSGLAGTMSTISGLQPDANVLSQAYTVSRNSVANVAQDDINTWIDSLELN